MNPRRSGLLLHPTSLPAATLGEGARQFVDFLRSAGQGAWQMLPTGPPGWGGSPYMSTSAFAGNVALLDADDLVAGGVVPRAVAAALPPAATDGAPYDAAAAMRRADALLDAAADAIAPGDSTLADFCARTGGWIEDFARFQSLYRRHDGQPWTTWSDATCDEAALHRERVGQMLFERQWRALRTYANARGVALVGDVPIFVAQDSADVWAYRDLFDLDESGRPLAVAGVPPDYFSPTGQRWGNPLYRWDVLAAQQYSWWVARFRAAFDAFDAVRVDHFRGFESYWRVPADAETAIEGAWVTGPGRALFDAVAAAIGVAVDALPIIVEDLGIITAEVEALRDALGRPGMAVLQFGFDGNPRNPHHPRNVTPRTVVYTGTHDNDTTAGWVASLDDDSRRRVCDEIGSDGGDLVGDVMAAAWASPAELAVAPVQDVLRLGTQARMNTPGTATGNWTWRMRDGALTDGHAAALAALTGRADRLSAR